MLAIKLTLLFLPAFVLLSWATSLFSVSTSTIFLAVLFTAFLLHLSRTENQYTIIPEGKKEVPLVDGCFPIVGHLFSFLFDMKGFLRRAQDKYGDIFKIKVFLVKLVIMCDRKYSGEFFAAKDENMSFYDVLERLYFGEAFACKKLPFHKLAEIMKKSVMTNGSNLDVILPKIQMEAEFLVERLKMSQTSSIDLRSELMRFVANTSARVFLGIPLTDEAYNNLVQFTDVFNRVIQLTFFVPRSLLRKLINWKLFSLRKKVVEVMLPEIKKYRDDPMKEDAYVIRMAVDYIDETTGQHLSDEEIGSIVLCILYVSTENTALALTNVLADLSKHPEVWKKVKAEVEKEDNKNLRTLVNSKYLHACIMETARLNSQVFAVSRAPSKQSFIHDYYVGDADVLAMGEMLLHFEGEAASKTFPNPKAYNPERFLTTVNGERRASYGPTSIMTWGAGKHQCTGKPFAFYEMKVALSYILQNFKMDLDSTYVSNPGYFSPAGVADREVITVLRTVL